ncbi:MAG: endonuclease domain-containing protein [Oscillospiraceae bacterium]|nr:endonuclease domain-containing protein [Oscillospiraceae bacterium]
MEYYAPHLRQYARELRKNQTKEERKLWYQFLKELPLTVKRQERVGRYIADFYIPSLRLAIELDGAQHFEGSGQSYDRMRNAFFEKKGIRVVRYPNNAVNQNFTGVCEDIMQQIRAAEKKDTETEK